MVSVRLPNKATIVRAWLHNPGRSMRNSDSESEYRNVARSELLSILWKPVNTNHSCSGHIRTAASFVDLIFINSSFVQIQFSNHFIRRWQ